MKKVIFFLVLLSAIYYSFSYAQTGKAGSGNAPVQTTPVQPPPKKIETVGSGQSKTICCQKWEYPGYGLIFLIIVLFIALALKSDILRDIISDNNQFLKSAGQQNPGKYGLFAMQDIGKIPRPYSLSRTQLGAWTVVIASAYIYRFFSYCCFNTSIQISSSTLLLMGISAGTAAAGNIIDKSQNPATRHQNEPSHGFFMDILSDENGISIHRFQNVIWTLVALFIYISKLCNHTDCSLPELDGTLVALTGISNATYLSLKVNENKQ